jgi:hypothetical protein
MILTAKYYPGNKFARHGGRSLSESLSIRCTAFAGDRWLASGPLIEIALAVKSATERDMAGNVLTFNDATGAVVDLDLRGTTAEMIARLSDPSHAASMRRGSERAGTPSGDGDAANLPRGRGRPRLGVIAREVTLLPRHWQWLASQPGGASGMLRRLVDQARRADGRRSEVRAAREAAYRFMAALAGDLAGFEEATRALFADDRVKFEREMAPWPADLRRYALKLAAGALTSAPGVEGQAH